jgi:hypothetical protein
LESVKSPGPVEVGLAQLVIDVGRTPRGEQRWGWRNEEDDPDGGVEWEYEHEGRKRGVDMGTRWIVREK